ncbi:MAG: hypothetical protein JNM65_02430, partial [Verrucomicrobiaceae bacterium]|nr:hypothetical protein [Verrucomicrobiaceae bacterium]
RALAAMYSVCLVLGLVGLSILLTKGVALPVAGAFLFLLALGAARYLGYVRSWKNFRTQINEVLERRRQREYFRAYGRVLDFEVERCESLESFSAIFQHGLERMGLSTTANEKTNPEVLQIGAALTCTLHHPQNDVERHEWHLRLDVLAPVLQRCLDKWGTLPPCLALEKKADALAQATA